MNLSVEHVLLFAFVVYVFYYLMNGCGGNLTEGVTVDVNCPPGCMKTKDHIAVVDWLQKQAAEARPAGGGTQCYSETRGAGI